MDNFLISQIIQYLPDSKSFEYAHSMKNRAISKILLRKCLLNPTYVVYINREKLRTIHIPTQKENTNYPKLKYSEMNSSSLSNLAFFYAQETNIIHTFQFWPAEYKILKFKEKIEIALFYDVGDQNLMININHTHIYVFRKLVLVKIIPLASGFIFEETLLDNIIYSEFFGNEIVVQQLDNNEEFNLKLKSNTYYDFISKDLILIDFSFAEEPLDNILPSNNLANEAKKNCLFKYHLLKGRPNKISLEFVAFLPFEYKFKKFCFKKGLYWARHDEQCYLTLWQSRKEIAKIEIADLDKVICIEQIDEMRLIVEYEKDIAIIDFELGTISPKIDMTKRIKDLRSLGSIKKVGDHFTLVCLLQSEDAGWREYVLDQNFCIIYEMESDEIFKNYVFPC